MNTSLIVSLDMRRQKKDGTYPIILRLTHFTKTTGIATGYSVAMDYWDEQRREIKKGCKLFENVTRVNNQIEKKRSAALDVITRLEDTGELTDLVISQVKQRIETKPKRVNCYAYIETVIADLVSQQRIGTANYYRNVLRELKTFRGTKDWPIRQLDYNFLLAFDTHYLAKGGQVNGLAAYMRGIKAIYNKAIKIGHVGKDTNPFDLYTIKKEPTKKRAIRRNAIDSIVALELKPGTKLHEAQCIFILSFHLRGANFIDLAFLKLSNFIDGRLNYQRSKTGKFFNVKINDEIQPIIDFYCQGKAQDDYMLPVITRTELEDQIDQINEARKRYNKRLKKLAKIAGVETNLTSYVSRHSFATIAKNKSIPIAAISEMLGHDRISTTQAYLADLPDDMLDEFQDKVLEQIDTNATDDLQAQLRELLLRLGVQNLAEFLCKSSALKSLPSTR